MPRSLYRELLAARGIARCVGDEHVFGEQFGEQIESNSDALRRSRPARSQRPRLSHTGSLGLGGRAVPGFSSIKSPRGLHAVFVPRSGTGKQPPVPGRFLVQRERGFRHFGHSFVCYFRVSAIWPG